MRQQCSSHARQHKKVRRATALDGKHIPTLAVDRYSLPQREPQNASNWKFNKLWTTFSDPKHMLPGCTFNAAANRIPQPNRCQLGLICNESRTHGLVRVAQGAHLQGQGYNQRPRECAQDVRHPRYRRRSATTEQSSNKILDQQGGPGSWLSLIILYACFSLLIFQVSAIHWIQRLSRAASITSTSPMQFVAPYHSHPSNSPYHCQFAQAAAYSSCFLILQSAAFCIPPRSFRHSQIAIHLLKCDSMNYTAASLSFCT